MIKTINPEIATNGWMIAIGFGMRFFELSMVYKKNPPKAAAIKMAKLAISRGSVCPLATSMISNAMAVTANGPWIITNGFGVGLFRKMALSMIEPNIAAVINSAIAA